MAAFFNLEDLDVSHDPAEDFVGPVLFGRRHELASPVSGSPATPPRPITVSTMITVSVTTTAPITSVLPWPRPLATLSPTATLQLGLGGAVGSYMPHMPDVVNRRMTNLPVPLQNVSSSLQDEASASKSQIPGPKASIDHSDFRHINLDKTVNGKWI